MKKGIQGMTVIDVIEHQKKHGFGVPKALLTADKNAIVMTQLSPKKRGGKLKRSRQPNVIEAEFGLMLHARRRAGEFAKVEFEPIKLRIGDGTFYIPDYMCDPETGRSMRCRCEGNLIIRGVHCDECDDTGLVEVADKRQAIFEVKGKQKWDDAIVKFKAARDRYGRWARFEMWDKIDGNWSQIA